MKTMKRSIKFFWRGLTGILAAVASWITVILGMKDESRYGKFLRRTVGTCFATLMLLLTCSAVWCVVGNCWKTTIRGWIKACEIPHYNNEYISPNLSFHIDYVDEGKGFVFDSNGRRVLKNVSWIALPAGEDSLVFYSDGKHRGYFNKNTGEVVIPPSYSHAWVFSEGLAAVEVDGVIKFIDQTGKVVAEPSPSIVSSPRRDYVYHDGYCITNDRADDHYGLLDRKGNHVLPFIYNDIQHCDSLWLAKGEDDCLLLSAQLDTILRLTDAVSFCIYDDQLQVQLQDHTQRIYTLQGELVDDNYIRSTEKMDYETNEIYYTDEKFYDDEGDYEVAGQAVNYRHAVANCMKYQAAEGWYGLMTPSGHIVTPPAYRCIKAIGPDLYLCNLDSEYGVLLNGKGEQVK